MNYVAEQGEGLTMCGPGKAALSGWTSGETMATGDRDRNGRAGRKKFETTWNGSERAEGRRGGGAEGRRGGGAEGAEGAEGTKGADGAEGWGRSGAMNIGRPPTRPARVSVSDSSRCLPVFL